MHNTMYDMRIIVGFLRFDNVKAGADFIFASGRHRIYACNLMENCTYVVILTCSGTSRYEGPEVTAIFGELGKRKGK